MTDRDLERAGRELWVLERGGLNVGSNRNPGLRLKLAEQRLHHPKQVDDIIKRFPEVAKARLVVAGEMAADTMTLKVETACSGPDALAQKIGEAIRDVTKLRGNVELVALGSLPNDGKVIEDARSYK